MTGWMGENLVGAAAHGGVRRRVADGRVRVLHPDQSILACAGPQSRLAAAVGKDVKGKLSVAVYAAAIPLAFVNRWIADAIYVVVVLMWLVPDRRIESKLTSRVSSQFRRRESPRLAPPSR